MILMWKKVRMPGVGAKRLSQRSALHSGVSEASFIVQDKFAQPSQLNGDTS